MGYKKPKVLSNVLLSKGQKCNVLVKKNLVYPGFLTQMLNEYLTKLTNEPWVSTQLRNWTDNNSHNFSPNIYYYPYVHFNWLNGWHWLPVFLPTQMIRQKAYLFTKQINQEFVAGLLKYRRAHIWSKEKERNMWFFISIVSSARQKNAFIRFSRHQITK